MEIVFLSAKRRNPLLHLTRGPSAPLAGELRRCYRDRAARRVATHRAEFRHRGGGGRGEPQGGVRQVVWRHVFGELVVKYRLPTAHVLRGEVEAG